MEIRISLSGGSSASLRPEKGRSVIAHPDTYCVIDTETTGLSPDYDSLIEVAAVRVTGGVIVDRFASLIRPNTFARPFLDDFISGLTGITDDMLEAAPITADVLPAFAAFIGDSLLVGHNVHFDINFLYDRFEICQLAPLKNDFVDTMRMARRLLPDLKHHRLSDLVKFYNIDQDGAHRALVDALTTADLYARLAGAAVEKYGTFDEFARSFKYSSAASHFVGDPSKSDPDSPLFGKHCVFTGKLERYTRAQAMQLVADLGGINDSSVTKHTNYLILGNTDYTTSLRGNKSTKQKKAEAAILAGQDLQVLPEDVFYDWLSQ